MEVLEMQKESGHNYLSRKITFCLELLEERGEEECCEEQDDRPKKNIWEIWTIAATS